MHLLWAMIIGLIVGAVARLLMPGRDRAGLLVTSLLGIAGALVATLIGQAAGWYRPGESAGFLASVLGAVVVLAGYRALAGRRLP